MDAAEDEGPHEECGHRPECQEDPWIFVRIMVCGVRQVPCEPPRHAGMALPAGGHYILAAYVRKRIQDRQDVVGAVTVVTLGGLRIPQLRHLAMEGVEIRLRNGEVTLAADVHDFEPERVLVGPLYLMRGVAVVAHWQLIRRRMLVSLVPLLYHRVYAADILFIDALVAL